jgi:hypothetical protein
MPRRHLAADRLRVCTAGTRRATRAAVALYDDVVDAVASDADPDRVQAGAVRERRAWNALSFVTR